KAVLLFTVVLVNVITPKLAIPPPSGSEKVQPSPHDIAAVATTWLRVIVLSVIVTVAPRHSSGSLLLQILPEVAAGTSMPPPTGLKDVGSVLLEPPVTVTPLTETVGSGGGPLCPIVSTGPPPLMIVAFAPAPTRR